MTSSAFDQGANSPSPSGRPATIPPAPASDAPCENSRRAADTFEAKDLVDEARLHAEGLCRVLTVILDDMDIGLDIELDYRGLSSFLADLRVAARRIAEITFRLGGVP